MSAWDGTFARGLFIVLEGGEGAAKTTQVAALANWLSGTHELVTTREPGGAPGSEILRTLLKSGDHDWSPAAEAFLHFAARAEHVEKLIRPALAAGKIVISDRFFDSTMAYQGYGQGADRTRISKLIELIDCTPDLTIMLDIRKEEADRRLQARGLDPDRYDKLGAAFHQRVRDAFLDIAAADPRRCKVVDATGTIEDVSARIREVVGKLLQRHDFLVPRYRPGRQVAA